MKEAPVVDTYLRSGELAKKFKLSRQTLRMWRIDGTGPEYVQLPGGSVRYRESAVAEWVKANSPQVSASEEGLCMTGIAHPDPEVVCQSSGLDAGQSQEGTVTK